TRGSSLCTCAAAGGVCGERLPKSQLLPDVGAIVTCKVCSINSRFAKVHILYIGLHAAEIHLPRREDIRATEKDKISLGDMQSNYLEAGKSLMVPISWCEMQCPRTHSKELRKVARVQPEFLQT
uniref:Exosome complex component CSL4 n=1 Tax=Gopherus evgoodei TaxID=1825980 RepID=A0A8C4VSN4_9SAUR